MYSQGPYKRNTGGVRRQGHIVMEVENGGRGHKTRNISSHQELKKASK